MFQVGEVKYKDSLSRVNDLTDIMSSKVVGEVTLVKDIANSKGRLTVKIGKFQKEEELILKEMHGKHYFFSNKKTYQEFIL